MDLERPEPFSLSSSSSVIEGISCQLDTRSATATSSITKAVIASQRSDFFSDLQTNSPPPSQSCMLNVSQPQICASVLLVAGSSFSTTVSSADSRNCFSNVDVSSAIIGTPRRSCLSNESDRDILSNEMDQINNSKICPLQGCSLGSKSSEADVHCSHFAKLQPETLVSLRSTSLNAVGTGSQPLVAMEDDLDTELANFTPNEIKNDTCKDPESQLAVPFVELVLAPVCSVEPVCVEMAHCVNGSVCLEPSPERIWGPQISFLTFSCLDISRTEVMGNIRQVNSTGCLETLGTGRHLESDHRTTKTKLLASDGDFSCSAQSVLNSEKSSKFEKSFNDEHKSGSVSKSFLEFDLGRVVHNGSFRSSKKSSVGRSLGWYSPSTRHKREESSPVLKPKETWKGKVVRTFKRYGSATMLPTCEPVFQRTKGTFGVPIELCTLSSKNKNLPLFVEFCSHIIEERGLENQGIYRVPGNSGSLKQMVEDLNEDPTGLCAENEKWLDVNVASSLLKLFFRRLPEPLITNELYQPVIAASRVIDSGSRLLKLRKVLRELPPINFQTFQFLAQHLRHVVEHEQVNKMDAHNLAIIFGPTLIRPYDNSVVTMVSDMNDQCRVVESIILHSDWFFGDLEDEVAMLRSEDSKDSTPVSSMSEELLAKAHQLGDIRRSVWCSSPAGPGADRNIEIPEADHKEKAKGVENPIHSNNDSGLATTTPSAAVTDDCRREVVFEIKRYPAYHFSDSSTFCTENAKPKVRRTHSNESLGRTGSSTAGHPSRQAKSPRPQTAFDASGMRLAK